MSDYSYFQVEKYLKNDFKNIDNSVEQFRDIIQELCNLDNFMIFINSIIEDELILEEVSRNSYNHLNGFSKFIPIRVSSSFWTRLRVHVWWGDHKSSDVLNYDIHDHSWNFVSGVVKGSLENHIFQLSNDGDHFFEHTHTIDNKSFRESLRFNKKVQLQLVQSSRISAGSIYYQDKILLHRTYPVDREDTVTILIQELPTSLSSKVYKKEEQNFSQRIGKNNATLSTKDVKNLLKKL